MKLAKYALDVVPAVIYVQLVLASMLLMRLINIIIREEELEYGIPVNLVYILLRRVDIILVIQKSKDVVIE
jgi:hypothetical protein